MKKIHVGVALVAVVFLVGCSHQEDAILQGENVVQKTKGYTERKIDTYSTAKDKITIATQAQNKKTQEALKSLEEKTMTTPHESINMDFAKMCKGAKVTTNKGMIEVQFDAEKAPITVANFCTLASDGFYDGIIFHRIIKGFMIQGGDPTGVGTGGPGYKFDDELPQAGKYKIGSLAMANSGPNTNGSQFFIVSGSAGVDLPPLYTLFGQVTAGLDVVTAIESVKTGAADKPVKDVVIESIELVM